MIRSSFAGFTTAQLGMSASQAALNVIGQNISNINVKGYTRQRVDLSSFNVTTGPRKWGSVNDTFIGNGVIVNHIEQVRDSYLDLRFRTEMSSVGYYDKTLAALEDLQAVLDEVDKQGSIHNQLEAIFKALNEFNPQAANNEFQNMAKTEMQLLTQYFNNYASRIEQTKNENLVEFRDQTMPAINHILEDISNLNRSIRENEIMGNPALELRDERNLLFDELSEYVKIEVTYENKYVGLSSKIAEECTVKLLGTDGDGNIFKYTLVDHDKASQFQINEDCSNLTMTDVNGNPVADIGSALKPVATAAGTTNGFTNIEATAINELLNKIQDKATEMKNQMLAIHKHNDTINAATAKINSWSKKGADLHKELKSALQGRDGVLAAIANYQEQIDALPADTPADDPQRLQLEAKLADRQRVLGIYNERLFGTKEAPAGIPNKSTKDFEDADWTAWTTAVQGLDVDEDNYKNNVGIYQKLRYIYGNVTNAGTEPPLYETKEVTEADGTKRTDFASGALRTARDERRTAQAALKQAQADFRNAEIALKEAIYGKENADGTRTKGLQDYANIEVDFETYPIDGTISYISLPKITLAGTSARDGEGIPLFDPSIKYDSKPETVIGKIGEITVNGNDITITDTRGVTYNEKVENVDGTPYKCETNANGNIEFNPDGTPKLALDKDGNIMLDMGDQRNMYYHMQEDSGSIKAVLDMFNRAGEFDGSNDRGYDYYLNMLDSFARRIAKTFNEANTQDKDGNPLLDANGKPIEYANALFGANGEIPVKYWTNASGQKIKFNGNEIPDVFRTDDDGYLLDDNGKQILVDDNGNVSATGKPISLSNGTADSITDPNPTGDLATIYTNAKLDPTALAAYGIVKSTTDYTDADGNNIKAGDWVDKDGKLIATAAQGIDSQKTPILNKIGDGTYKLLDGKVPKIDYDQITASNLTITKDWAEAKTNFVQTHDPSQTPGYNDNINHLISQFTEKLDYTFTQPDGTQKKVFNGTFVEFYDNLGNQMGLDIKSNTVLVTNYITVANDIANNRDAISGVSLDEEGIDILKYQKAYAASARLMTALDEALDKVINGMGVVGR